MVGGDAAIPFFKHAIEIDPKFAIAYASLGLMYGSMGETEVGTENTKKAYELRNRVSDNEKFFITAYYDGRATGNQKKAQQTCEAWAQAYPREWTPHSFLAGFIYPVLGEHEKAAEEAQKAIELAHFGVGYALLGSNSVSLDRLGAAEDAVRRASERKIDIPLLALLRYDVAFLKGDLGGMQREVAAARGKSGVEELISDHQAFTLAYATCKRPRKCYGGQAIWRSRRLIEKRPLHSKPDWRCGKPFTGTRQSQGRQQWQPSRLPRTGRCSMARPSPWLSRGILRRLKH